MHVHKNLKEREYSCRGMAVEKEIVFNAKRWLDRLISYWKQVEKLFWKRNTPYSKMTSFARKEMRFDLNTETIHGYYRGKPSSNAAPLKDLDIYL